MIPVAAMGLVAGGTLLLSQMEQPERELEIPIHSLTRKQWLDFVRVCSNGNPRMVTPSFRLGVFELTVRRLCDLGAMHKPRVVRYNGNQVWDAEWLRPKTLEAFQDDPMAQYTLFADSIARYASDGTVTAYVGSLIDGAMMTLSGALCVAHRAGLPGLTSWAVSPSERQKFSRNTTAHFQRANGLF